MAVFVLCMGLSVLVQAQEEAADPTLVDGCIPQGAFDPNTDYFPTKVSSHEAGLGYKIEYHSSYKAAINTEVQVSEKAAKVSHASYLYQCGSVSPKECKDAPAEFNHTTCMPIPVETVGVSDTVAITFLEILGVIEKVRYVASMEFVTSPCLQKWARQLWESEGHEIKEANDPAVVTKQRAGVDVYFQSENNFVGEAFGDNSVFTSEAYDNGALTRPEWLGFFASFFNLEKVYYQYMGGLKERWYKTTNLTANVETRPIVTMVSYLDWYKPNITYEVLMPDYMHEIITAAGGTPKPKKNFEDVNEFLKYIADAEYVIDQAANVSTTSFFEKYAMTGNESYPFVQNKGIYAIDKRMNINGGLDWYESALAKPDLVLRDVVSIIHPDLLEKDRTYLRNIYDEQIVILTEADCTEEFGLSASTATADAQEGETAPTPDDSQEEQSSAAQPISCSLVMPLALSVCAALIALIG